MRLGGRLAGAIEVLADIEGRRRPVADALKDWGLAHRFAGSGDRAAIGNIVYDALRMKLSHAWLMDDDSAASLAYAVLLRQWGKSFAELTAEFDGDKFAPPRPTRKAAGLSFPFTFRRAGLYSGRCSRMGSIFPRNCLRGALARRGAGAQRATDPRPARQHAEGNPGQGSEGA